MGYVLNMAITTKKLLTIFVLFFWVALLVLKHINLHDQPITHKNTKPQHWLQPISLNDQYPQLIGNENWSLEFSNIERIINRLELDAKNNLVINSGLNEKLLSILSNLDESLSDKQWQRLQFLLIKSLGQSTAEELYTLINSYHHYQQQAHKYAHTVQKANKTEKLALLKNSHNMYIHLQNQYFGPDIAEALFDKKNKVTRYLNSIRIINMDDSLTPSQKKEQLALLSSHYKQSLTQR